MLTCPSGSTLRRLQNHRYKNAKSAWYGTTLRAVTMQLLMVSTLLTRHHLAKLSPLAPRSILMPTLNLRQRSIRLTLRMSAIHEMQAALTTLCKAQQRQSRTLRPAQQRPLSTMFKLVYSKRRTLLPLQSPTYATRFLIRVCDRGKWTLSRRTQRKSSPLQHQYTHRHPMAYQCRS